MWTQQVCSLRRAFPLARPSVWNVLLLDAHISCLSSPPFRSLLKPTLSMRPSWGALCWIAAPTICHTWYPLCPYSVSLHGTSHHQTYQISMFLCLQLIQWKAHPWGLSYFALFTPLSLMSGIVPGIEQMLTQCLLNEWMSEWIYLCWRYMCIPYLKRIAEPNIWSSYILVSYCHYKCLIYNNHKTLVGFS